MSTMVRINARRPVGARQRAGVVGVSVLLATMVFTAGALGAHPVKGASYNGPLLPATKQVTVSFTVSANGCEVTALRISNLPLYCSGGGPAVPEKFHNAKVTKAGTFKSTAKQIISAGPYKGQVGARLSITGRFTTTGERGTLTTTFSKAPSCSGKSAYTTLPAG